MSFTRPVALAVQSVLFRNRRCARQAADDSLAHEIIVVPSTLLYGGRLGEVTLQWPQLDWLTEFADRLAELLTERS
ncbi:hypothetical protein ACIPSE_43480 [Streptomyces sp. NPDC090106]|uniref:hypothetical protein n=1 Tax=Streptomyces sp. NPDC090106 TaxID=3365946 RepID=UPI003812AD82